MDLVLFEERSQDVGLDFVHDNGMSGQLYFPEVMGAGGAFLDFDNDGDLDIFLIQGHPLGQPVEGVPSLDRLYRNDLVDGVMAFVDVTEESGLLGDGYGMGVAVGDVDNDGWVDLYTTNFGPNRLWRNLGPNSTGQVQFEDITKGSRTEETGWSTSATFLDLDRDGWLDLYVTNYVEYSIAGDVSCQSPSGLPDYCSPNSYHPTQDRLFRNLGLGPDGKVLFEDVSVSSGVASERGNGLGVVALDADLDGWLDLYVANDLEPNVLWRNQMGDGSEFRLVNEALVSGSALNYSGKAEASMGVVTGDVDEDGDEDLFMTHLNGETNTFYLNDGQGFFEDRTSGVNLAAGSLAGTGFGTAFLDFDNDRLLDVLVVNGAVTTIEELAQLGDPYPLHQTNQILRNQGIDGKLPRFLDITDQAGPAFEVSEVSRGASIGDVDNDGDPDILITNNHGPVRLLVNQAQGQNRWVGLRLWSQEGREALGAEVSVRSSGRTFVRRVRTDSSYCSAQDSRILVGLGPEAGPVDVEVQWLSGREERWTGLESDRYHDVREGEGEDLGIQEASSEP